MYQMISAQKWNHNSQESNKTRIKTYNILVNLFQDITHDMEKRSSYLIYILCFHFIGFQISFSFIISPPQFFSKFLFFDIQTASHLCLCESREMLLLGTGSQAQLGPATPDFCLVSVFFLVFVFVFVGIRPQLHSWARPHLIFAFVFKDFYQKGKKIIFWPYCMWVLKFCHFSMLSLGS